MKDLKSQSCQALGKEHFWKRAICAKTLRWERSCVSGTKWGPIWLGEEDINGIWDCAVNSDQITQALVRFKTLFYMQHRILNRIVNENGFKQSGCIYLATTFLFVFYQQNFKDQVWLLHFSSNAFQCLSRYLMLIAFLLVKHTNVPWINYWNWFSHILFRLFSHIYKWGLSIVYFVCVLSLSSFRCDLVYIRNRIKHVFIYYQ